MSLTLDLPTLPLRAKSSGKGNAIYFQRTIQVSSYSFLRHGCVIRQEALNSSLMTKAELKYCLDTEEDSWFELIRADFRVRPNFLCTLTFANPQKPLSLRAKASLFWGHEAHTRHGVIAPAGRPSPTRPALCSGSRVSMPGAPPAPPTLGAAALPADPCSTAASPATSICTALDSSI